jgi:acyl carrier protein
MKPSSDAEAYLRMIIARYSWERPDSIGLDDDLRGATGMDSLTQLQVVAAFEERFGVRIPDDEIDRMRTLRDFLELIGSVSAL